MATLLLATACGDAEDEQLSAVGVTRLLLVDPAQSRQNLTDPDLPVEVAQWQITQALLAIDGEVVDLRSGGACDMLAFRRAVFVDGACSTGIIIGSDRILSVRLTLGFQMDVWRAKPVDLVGDGDTDGDGVPSDGDGSGSAFDAPCGHLAGVLNCDDNCPLQSNPPVDRSPLWASHPGRAGSRAAQSAPAARGKVPFGQEDENADGIGDACSIGSAPDSDADGIADGSDNCQAVSNPLQTDMNDLVIEDFRGNGIGDACEQAAAVTGPITLEFDIAGFIVRESGVTLLTVDLNTSRVLDCDWEAGTCTLDPDEARICTTTSDFDAQASGCDGAVTARAVRFGGEPSSSSAVATPAAGPASSR